MLKIYSMITMIKKQNKVTHSQFKIYFHFIWQKAGKKNHKNCILLSAKLFSSHELTNILYTVITLRDAGLLKLNHLSVRNAIIFLQHTITGG